VRARGRVERGDADMMFSDMAVGRVERRSVVT
jgi:hypothetical protein